MKEARKNARQRDFARKWRQGDRLDLYRGDEEYSSGREMDDYEIDDEGLTDADRDWEPDADDLRDFMEETGETDPTKIHGYKDEMSQEFTLSDILRSNIYPSVRGESGLTNKLEREIYPIMRAVKNAPQLLDRIVSLINSDFGRLTFYESMLFSKMLNEKEVEELKANKDDLMSSEMYKYVTHQTIVHPAMKQLAKMARKGDYDPMNKKSQISPDQADEMIEAVKKRWNGMTKARKANDAIKGMQANYEFLNRDTSVMG